MNLSFWEKSSFSSYDYIIIGAGITGLSLACELADAYPDASIAVLERGILPSGASTKNAGFACIGSLSEKVHDLHLMGEAAFLQLIQDRKEGLAILRNRLGDTAIDYQSHGGYELVMEGQDTRFMEDLESMNQRLMPLFGEQVFSVQNEKINSFGLNPTRVKQLIVNSTEGQLDTGKMMKALIAVCRSKGINLISGVNITEIEEQSSGVKLISTGMPFEARFVFLCTNAFTKRFLPAEEIEPGRGQVLVTKPIPALKLKGIFSFDEGYYYFRNINNRLIFGGGRNLDFEGERTESFGSNQAILDQLQYYLKEVILPDTSFEIDYNWSGIMAFGGQKQALVKRVSDRLFVGARLNGMGVAIGSKVARQLLTLHRQHS